MTIRFTCAGCGSLLKIKDDLAGTDGKCPKCKTEFVVPDAESDEGSVEIEVPKVVAASAPKAKEEDEVDESPAPVREKKPEKVAEKFAEKVHEKVIEKAAKGAKSKKGAGSGDDFDAAAFLMEDENGAPRKPSFNIREEAEPALKPPAESDTKTKRPMPKSSASVPAGSDSGFSASAHAKEMMMKAMEDSRAHASEMPQEPEKEGFDFAGMFREIGLKGGAILGGALIVSVGLYFLFDRMLGGSLKLPKLGYVTGTVTLDGQPLSGATVFFEPKDATIADSKKDRPRTSVGMTDDKGFYRMYYVDKTQGVAAGKCRVWLSLIGPKGQVIPADYTDGMMQVRDVAPGKSQEINFPLKTQ